MKYVCIKNFILFDFKCGNIYDILPHTESFFISRGRTHYYNLNCSKVNMKEYELKEYFKSISDIRKEKIKQLLK